jgi:hypothetical protein
LDCDDDGEREVGAMVISRTASQSRMQPLSKLKDRFRKGVHMRPSRFHSVNGAASGGFSGSGWACLSSVSVCVSVCLSRPLDACLPAFLPRPTPPSLSIAACLPSSSLALAISVSQLPRSPLAMSLSQNAPTLFPACPVHSPPSRGEWRCP